MIKRRWTLTPASRSGAMFKSGDRVLILSGARRTRSLVL